MLCLKMKGDYLFSRERCKAKKIREHPCAMKSVDEKDERNELNG